MKSSHQMIGWRRLLRGYHIAIAVGMLISVWFFMFGSPRTSALTTVPTKMNFQGRLTDSAGNIKPNDTYNMKLSLYTASSGGSAVWTEDRLVSATQGITVTNGLFSIKLGEVTTLPASLFASGDLYLEVELPTPASATTSSPVWTEGAMTPRNQMATSAYAYNAETLDGLDSAAFGQLGASNTWTTANTFNVLGANAFRIQNGSAVDILKVDTSSHTVTLGTSGDFDTLSKLSNPATLPTGESFGTAWSPDGQYLSVAHSTSPYLTIYKRSGDTLTKLPNPASLPTGQGNSTSWSSDGQYLSVAHLFSPYITVYKRSGDTFTKLSDPASLPPGGGYNTSWSPDGQYMSVGHVNSPYVSVYKRSGDTLTKLTDPASLPATSVLGTSWSSDGKYMSVATGISPYVIIYKRSGDTFTKLSDPASLPAGSARGVAFSPDGTYLSVAHGTTPFVTIYKRSGDTFTKLSDPASLPAGYGYGTSWSPDGQYMSIIHLTSPYLTLYKRSGDTFTKLSDPASLPAGSGRGGAFSPDGQFLSVAHGTSPYITVYKASGQKVTGDFQGSVTISNNLSASNLTVTYGISTSSLFTNSLQANGDLSATGLLGSTGTASFTNSTNSTSAFAINNAANATLFNVDTTNAGTVTILGNNSGEAGVWITNTNPTPAAQYAPGSVVANGYVYVVGGWGSTAVYYAKLNADGSTGTWQTSANILPAARHELGVVTANGYLYAIGGNDTTTAQNTVYYAKLNADGSVGAWQTAGNALPEARDGLHQTTVAANGYVYILGGWNPTNGDRATTYYAKLNADGTVGAWQTNGTSFATSRYAGQAVVANGYVYYMGGRDGATNASTSVLYAPINANGSLGTWTSAANTLPSGRTKGSTGVSNGYVYVVGGEDNAGAVQSTVYYAKLNLGGAVGAWSTSANPLPAIRAGLSSAVANGYYYAINGSNPTSQTTVYYARLGGTLQVGGNLDLVGLQGQTLADGGSASAGSTGGSITAGNIHGVGTLQIQGEAMFAGSASVTGNFTAGNGIFAVDTGSNTVRVGSLVADATGVVLVLDTKNTAGDPTGVNGAMYYNSSTNKFRCYQNSVWRNCYDSTTANLTIPAGNTVANTTTETTFTSTYTVGANQCTPGKVYRITARGLYSTAASAPNLNTKVYFGSTNVLLTGSTSTTASMNNSQWTLTGDIICLTSGATGTIESQGTVSRTTSNISAAVSGMERSVSDTVDLTVSNAISIRVTWSAASASNSIQLRQFIVEEKNP